MTIKRCLAACLLLYVILGSWKGYLALFDAGEDEPRQIFPATVSALPDEDRKNLEEGIIVRNDRDLQALLENYLS